MALEQLIYSNLKEETVVEGWDKETIHYLTNNEKKVKNIIGKMIRKRYGSFVDTLDAEDVYSDVLIHMYKTADYDVNKAVVKNASGNNYLVTLEDYIFSNVKNCVLRYLEKEITLKTLDISNETTSNNGETLDLFNLVCDEKSVVEYEDILVDLKEHCREYESQRYKYGVDIYLLWFIGLSLIKNNAEEKYDYILNVLGYSKKDLKEVFAEAIEDEMIKDFAVGINKIGIDTSINILKDYIYSAKNILKAIEGIAA